MTAKKMSQIVAETIYNILIRECGASEYNRRQFVEAHCRIGFPETPVCREFRFQGVLGFGGKFRNVHGKWYVDYYQEDTREYRDAVVEIANRKLQTLREQVHGS